MPERFAAQGRYEIKLERIGWFWGWAVFNGESCVATDILPRLNSRTAQRAAHRAARRVARRGGAEIRRYRFDA